MSTLNEFQRLALIVIYDLWVIAGLSLCFLYIPVLIIRVRRSGHKGLFSDSTGLLLAALLMFVAGTTAARFYFLIQMRWVNQGRFDSVARWTEMYGWLPVIAQAACVVALVVFIRIYFQHQGITLGWRRNIFNLVVGWVIVLGVLSIELMLWA